MSRKRPSEIKKNYMPFYPFQKVNLFLVPRPKIKHFAVLFLPIVFLCSRSAAQYNPEYHYPTAGLIGGVDFTQVDGDGYRGYNKVGWTGGGILFLPLGDVDMPIEGTVAFSMEVAYTQKGASGKGFIPTGGIQAQDIRLHYAEIPIQINLFRGARRSGFGAGLSLGYLGFSEETVTDLQGTQLKPGLPFRKLDFSFVLSGHIHIFKGLFVSPKFQYSLLSVRNNNGQYGGRDAQFNNLVALRVMYLFKRGR